MMWIILQKVKFVCHKISRKPSPTKDHSVTITIFNKGSLATTANIGTLSVQELFFQLIGWLGVKLGVSPVGMVYFMG